MLSMNRLTAMAVSLKQTVFAIMFLMSETTTESELGTREKIFSICLMFIDFLQVHLQIEARVHLSNLSHLYNYLLFIICRCCGPQCLSVLAGLLSLQLV
jgi:hypothetical protein